MCDNNVIVNMKELTHIYLDSYEHSYYGRSFEEQQHHPVEVQIAYCGLQDYAGVIDFALYNEEATCQNCIDECALNLLKALDD